MAAATKGGVSFHGEWPPRRAERCLVDRDPGLREKPCRKGERRGIRGALTTSGLRGAVQQVPRRNRTKSAGNVEDGPRYDSLRAVGRRDRERHRRPRQRVRYVAARPGHLPARARGKEESGVRRCDGERYQCAAAGIGTQGTL